MPTYVLLSPTFGMHQYTADYANRLAMAGDMEGNPIVVTTSTYPTTPYLPQVAIRTPVTTRDSGFRPNAIGPFLRLFVRDRVENLNVSMFTSSNLVHFTGPHLWDLPLLCHLRRAGIPTIHTLHDLDPHPGRGPVYNVLLQLWNRLIARTATHILVHGRLYRDRIVRWIGEERVTYVPLLHGFWQPQRSVATDHSPLVTNSPFALFFGRLEAYKGVSTLLQATLLQSQVQASGLPCGLQDSWNRLDCTSGEAQQPRLVIAGKGDLAQVWDDPLPPVVEVRNRHIDDEEAIDLFRRCAVVVLPYRQATQSALVAAAYVFRTPVIVTDTGAMAEYVVEGETGWIVEAQNPGALARVLSQALADPLECRRRGEAGRAWYDQQRVAEWATLQAMYQRVAERT